MACSQSTLGNLVVVVDGITVLLTSTTYDWFDQDLRSLQNTNRKSNLARQTLPVACYSTDQTCSKSSLGPTDFIMAMRL